MPPTHPSPSRHSARLRARSDAKSRSSWYQHRLSDPAGSKWKLSFDLLAYFDDIIKQRAAHFFEPMWNPCGNDDNIALHQLACLAANNLPGAGLPGSHCPSFHRVASGHKRRRAFENVKNIGIAVMHLDFTGDLASACL